MAILGIYVDVVLGLALGNSFGNSIGSILGSSVDMALVTVIGEPMISLFDNYLSRSLGKFLGYQTGLTLDKSCLHSLGIPLDEIWTFGCITSRRLFCL